MLNGRNGDVKPTTTIFFLHCMYSIGHANLRIKQHEFNGPDNAFKTG